MPTLTEFKPHFDNMYEEIFNLANVSKEIINLRYESTLGKVGESVARRAYDLSQVIVRDVVEGAASTIDPVTDSTELMLINFDKETCFYLSDRVVSQTGDNPGEKIGTKIALKVANAFDARIFSEVLNAYQTFDTGDLTTLVSTGVPITMSTTNTPLMAARLPAKLMKGGKQTLSNMAFVIDSYGVAELAQYYLSKQFNIVDTVLKNGFANDDFASANVYVSENLTATTNLYMATDPTATNTVTINGIVFTAVTSLTGVAGQFIRGVSADDSRANLAALINTPGTTTVKVVALSAADQALVREYGLSATNNDSTDYLSLTGTSGRLTVSETLTNASDIWSNNCIHAYYGKKGAIDAVMQKVNGVDMRPTSDRRGTNVFSNLLGAIKVFADGARQFIDVKISA